MDSTDEPRWYAIYCQPNREQKVYDSLDGVGDDRFFPWYLERVRTSQRGRFRDIKRALYPRYCFVRCRLGSAADVYSIHGVCSLVGCASKPWPIPDRIMGLLTCEALSTGQVLMGKKKRKRFNKGDKVKVVDDLSPLQGFMLTIAANSSIMASCLTETGLKVEIPISSVKKVD